MRILNNNWIYEVQLDRGKPNVSKRFIKNIFNFYFLLTPETGSGCFDSSIINKWLLCVYVFMLACFSFSFCISLTIYALIVLYWKATLQSTPAREYKSVFVFNSIFMLSRVRVIVGEVAGRDHGLKIRHLVVVVVAVAVVSGIHVVLAGRWGPVEFRQNGVGVFQRQKRRRRSMKRSWNWNKKIKLS